MENQTLDEVKSPLVRAKLEGIQELVSDTDQEILASRKALVDRRAMIEAGELIYHRIMQECLGIQAKVDKEEITMAEGKQYVALISGTAGLVRSISDGWKNEQIQHQGKIAGLERIAEIAGRRFASEVQKYERHQRMEEEDAAFKKTPEPEPKGKGKKRKKG